MKNNGHGKMSIICPNICVYKRTSIIINNKINSFNKWNNPIGNSSVKNIKRKMFYDPTVICKDITLLKYKCLEVEISEM